MANDEWCHWQVQNFGVKVLILNVAHGSSNTYERLMIFLFLFLKFWISLCLACKHHAINICQNKWKVLMSLASYAQLCVASLFDCFLSISGDHDIFFEFKHIHKHNLVTLYLSDHTKANRHYTLTFRLPISTTYSISSLSYCFNN